MDDFELNKAIAKAVYPNNDWFLYEHAPNGSSVENGNGCILNFIDSWDCLMPLVVKYDVYYQIDKHLTARRLAEALLKVLESKNA